MADSGHPSLTGPGVSGAAALASDRDSQLPMNMPLPTRLNARRVYFRRGGVLPPLIQAKVFTRQTQVLSTRVFYMGRICRMKVTFSQAALQCG